MNWRPVSTLHMLVVMHVLNGKKETSIFKLTHQNYTHYKDSIQDLFHTERV